MPKPDDIGVDTVEFTTFDPDMIAADAAGADADSAVTPLPVSDLTDLLDQATEPTETPEAEIDDPVDAVTASMSDRTESASELSDEVPESLSDSGDLVATESIADIDKALGNGCNPPAAIMSEEEVAQFAGDTGYAGDQPMDEAIAGSRKSRNREQPTPPLPSCPVPSRTTLPIAPGRPKKKP